MSAVLYVFNFGTSQVRKLFIIAVYFSEHFLIASQILSLKLCFWK